MAEHDPNSTASTGPMWSDVAIGRGCAVGLCLFLIGFFFVQIFFLFGFWPQVDPATKDWTNTFKWFLWQTDLKVEPGQRLVIVVLICGGIGAQVHTLGSFAIHMAHRDFSRYWIYWYVLRPFQGSVVAFVVYFVFAAGLAGEVTKAATTPGGDATEAAMLLANKMTELFRAGAIAGLVGMFSDSAVEKMREIANTILAKPVSKSAEAAPAGPQLVGDPPAISAEANQNVTLKGRGLDKVTKVEIGAETAVIPDIKDRTAIALTVTVDGAKLKPGKHAIKIDGKDTGKQVTVA